MHINIGYSVYMDISIYQNIFFLATRQGYISVLEIRIEFQVTSFQSLNRGNKWEFCLRKS